MPKVAAVWYAGIESVAPVPEPSALVLAGTGLLALLAICVAETEMIGLIQDFGDHRRMCGE